MALSDIDIKARMEEGEVVISPFNSEDLGSASYDVRLGPWYYQAVTPMFEVFYNIYSEASTRRVWGKKRLSQMAADVMPVFPSANWENISPREQVILLKPHANLLCHTIEFIGARSRHTTMMKARSSIGRSLVNVCQCLPKDTLVRKADGSTVAIGELQVGNQILNANEQGKVRLATVKVVVQSTQKKTAYRLITRSRREFIVSGDHLLRVSRSDGPKVINARNATTDDYLPILAYCPKLDNFDLTPQEAALLGYFVAEGHWSKYRISFAKADFKSEQRNEILQLMAAVFPKAPSPILRPEKIEYNGVDFCEIFSRRYAETSVLGENKRLPIGLFASSEATIKEFFRTYLACDGFVRDRTKEVETSSRSQQLIFDLALLAARFRAVPHFTETISGGQSLNTVYRGYYYGTDACYLLDRNLNSNKGWPVDISNLMTFIRGKYSLTRKDMAGYATTDRKAISRIRLNTIFTTSGVSELSPYGSDLVWDKIESIENIGQQSQMVDISLDVESEEDSLFALDNGLMVLNCAGMGDVGYVNRWTMEIFNRSDWYIPLVVGRRIAQIVFLPTGPTERRYASKYQCTDDVAQLTSAWSPELMLPRLDRDREVVRGDQ